MHPIDLFVIFLFCVLFQKVGTIFHVNTPIDFVPEKVDVDDIKKTNVVLFLAMPDSNNQKNGDGDQDKYLFELGFEKRAVVQACPGKDPFEAYIERKSPECDCGEFLKASLMSLINYSRNARGMVTALATSINDSFVGPQFGMGDQDTHASLESFDKVERTIEDLPKIEGVEPNEDDDTFGGFPMFYAIPKKRKMEWPKRQGVVLRKQLSIQPEFGMKPIQVINLEKHITESKPKSLKEILGLMANIRSAFFNDFFYNEIDPRRHSFDDSSGFSLTNMGGPNEPPLPDLVKRTLESSQKESSRGFLMAVIGGDLQDSTKPTSDLFRSIKHVVENTDDKNTLIVVTGMCPKSPKNLVPIYAKGPNSVIFSTARTLPDVPKLIKDTFTRRSPIEIVHPPKKAFEEETYGEKILKDTKDTKNTPLDEPHIKTYVKRDANFDDKSNNACGVTILRISISCLFALIFVF